MNYRVKFSIDGNEAKAGQTFCGKEIFTPDKIAGKSDECFVIIASSFCKSIMSQLFSLGYTETDMCGVLWDTHTPLGEAISVQLEITDKCNLKCHFCIVGTNKEKSTYRYMPVEIAKKTIDNILEAGIDNLQFMGGAENTVHREYIEILNYAASRFECIIITTNGHALTKEIRDAILNPEHKSNFIVHFSATGFNTDTYNEFQGSGLKDKSDRLRNNIYNIMENFVDERNAKNKKVSIVLKYILTDDNLDDFKEYVNFWGDKVDAILASSLWNLNEQAAPRGVMKKLSYKVFCHKYPVNSFRWNNIYMLFGTCSRWYRFGKH